MRKVIHWFRRDLRLKDNTALAAASAADQVVPVYILSDWKKGHAWTGPNRQHFLCESLKELAEGLKGIDGRLLVRRGRADEVLRELLEETGAEAVYFNRDPDLYGREMERAVEKMAKALGRAVFSSKDHVLHERDEVLTQSGDPYRVFTPYGRAWRKAPKEMTSPTQHRLDTPAGLKSLPLPTVETWGLKRSDVADIIRPGEKAARQRMRDFLAGPIFAYDEKRNLPADDATSRLSQDLRWGLISIRELYQGCEDAPKGAGGRGKKGVETYINELGWREFGMQILFHFPGVLEGEFNEKFTGLDWRESGEELEAWKAGRTGFPMVDAGMRQLLATGFMHNRLRMIVAMFLTKDLRLYWMSGESHFMQHLTDGEIASNNLGWQWSAGTGADAAPYFRIQNPWSQTKRYDPEGGFIKKWVPELREVDPEKFLQPPEEGESLTRDYPPPIVDHAEARKATLRMFKADA